MSENLPAQCALFDVGPFPHLQKPIAPFASLEGRAPFKAAAVLLIGWVPLVVLVILQRLFQHDYPLNTFFTDFGVHARSLFAAPLFFVAEAVCLPRLGNLANHFVTAGMIADADRGRFDAAFDSTRRLLKTTPAEVVALLLTYGAILLLIGFLPTHIFPLWFAPSGGGYRNWSWAGWWYAVVSLPLLLLILLGWLWRIVLWARFLFLVSRIRLRLIPSHPDLAGGLKFLDLSLYAFIPVGFTLGIIAAGAVGNQIVSGEISPGSFHKPMLGLLVVVLIVFVGPLLVFVASLREQIRRGVFQYGVLVHGVGEQFEAKWCQGQPIGPEALEAPDFSATTDLYSVVANVDQMRSLPFDLRSVIPLVVATLLPFVPVALMAIPLDVILKEIASLLF